MVEKSSLIRVDRKLWRQVAPSSPNPNWATVYSGRSSWSDLMAMEAFQVLLYVNTTSGKSNRGRLQKATGSSVTLADAFGKEVSLAKPEIARADFVQAKPLNDNQEFYWEELAAARIFDPALYPRLLHLGDKMQVRLYDSALPEDNSPIQCK